MGAVASLKQLGVRGRARGLVAGERRRLTLAVCGAPRTRAPQTRAARVPPLWQRRGRGRDAHDLPLLVYHCPETRPLLAEQVSL
jgi:hypothetical protein